MNAAGAWAAAIGRLAGVEIPVAPVRRHVAATEPFAGLPESMPLTIWIADGFHLRVRDGRVLLLKPRDLPSDQTGDDRFDPDWLRGLHELAARYVPCLAGARIDIANSWAGLYEMSPDKHAILGPAPGIDNLWLINGSSGHGVMHAGALGQLLAEMLIDGKAHTLDTTPLDPGRFLAGNPNPDASYLSTRPPLPTAGRRSVRVGKGSSDGSPGRAARGAPGQRAARRAPWPWGIGQEELPLPARTERRPAREHPLQRFRRAIA